MTTDAGDLTRLATTLFDLRAALENELRALTWVQRSLEGIRAGQSCGDPDLLLQEIARRFRENGTTSAAASDHRATAGELVAALLDARDAFRRGARPLTIVAA